MTNKNYNDMSDNEIRIIGGAQKKYFCRAFAATCPYFENTGLCMQGDCYHADKNIPSADEMQRLQLMELRRTQLKMAEAISRDAIGVPRYKPLTR